MPSDWKFNFDPRPGRVKCHGRGDIVRGKNMDWATVSGDSYLLQKLKIYFSLPPGEVINEPGLGTSLFPALFQKTSPKALLELRLSLQEELDRLLPELKIYSVTVTKLDQDTIRVELKGENDFLFNISRDDLLDLNLIDIFGGYDYDNNN